MHYAPPLPEINLQSLILYNIDQWKTLEKSFENYKKVCRWPVRTTLISEEEFRYLFDQYSEQYNTLSRIGCKLPKYGCEMCIHSDFVEGIPGEKSYKKMKNAFGAEEMKMEIFEYFHDKLEIKAASKHLKFSNLPFDIIKIIVKKADLKSRLNLRKVSRDLRKIVDKQKPAFKDICIKYKNISSIFIDFNNQELLYTSDRCLPKRSTKKVIQNHEFEEIAFNDLEFAFRNPDVRLNSLHIRFTDSHYEQRLKHFLNSLNHQIHVESCSIEFKYEENVMTVLKCLKPEVLKELTLSYVVFNGVFNDFMARDVLDNFVTFDEISAMNQWKQVKHVRVLDTEVLWIDPFFHCNKFEVRVDSIPLEDLLKLRYNATQSTNFEACTIFTKESMDVDFIASGLQLQTVTSHYNTHLYHIPESKNELYFRLSPFMIQINR